MILYFPYYNIPIILGSNTVAIDIPNRASGNSTNLSDMYSHPMLPVIKNDAITVSKIILI